MRTFSITDVGMVRQVNQDYVYATDRPLGILRNLFVVADGMGGHQAGDYASKYTVEVLKRELERSEGEDIERVLVGAIKTANREIIKEASRDAHLKGMGTTVVAATIVNQMMYFANVGDSRLYLINQGIQQLTKDHSLVEEMVRLGGIKPEEAKHHPDKNIITRAIGAKADWMKAEKALAPMDNWYDHNFILRGTPGQAYNVTNMDTAVSIREMAQLVCGLVPEQGIQLRFDTPENLASFGYNPEMVICLDSRKLQSLGWQAEVGLEEMFRRLIQSMAKTR